MKARILLLLILTACGIPRDPEGTLDRVRGGVLRVGVSPSEPWARTDGAAPEGVEAELVERFARELGARIEWFPGGESELLQTLHLRELDLVIGGLTDRDPALAVVGHTRPYIATRLVVGVTPGRTAPESIEGVRVWVEEGTPAAGLVRREGGIPVPVEDLRDASSPAVVPNWLLDDLGLDETDILLEESKHVLAVPSGENAWLSALERFLDRERAGLSTLLQREGRP